MKYFIEYVLGWHGPSNIKADMGTIVHKVLEILSLLSKANQSKKRIYYDDICGKLNTRYYDINQITSKVYHYYSQKFTQHKWSDYNWKLCKDWVWKALKFNDGMFDPRKRDIVDAEPHFDFEIDEPWAEYDFDGIKGRLGMKGTIDLVTAINDDIYEIIDWKTGQNKNWWTGEIKDLAYLQNDPQLRIYHYAAHQLYPYVEQIMVTIFYINYGGPFTICFSNDDLEKTKLLLKEKFQRIKDTRIPQLNKTWLCSKFCNAGKTTFEGTDHLPIIEEREGQVCGLGSCMTKCEQIKYEIESKGIDWVTENYQAPGHHIDNYKAPGGE